jgi:hypothetical protein
MNRVDDLAVVEALEVDRGDAEVDVSELALDDQQRHALASHLHGVRVTKLMRGEALSHAGLSRRTERGERFLPSAYRLLEAADHALATGLGEEPRRCESTSGDR